MVGGWARVSEGEWRVSLGVLEGAGVVHWGIHWGCWGSLGDASSVLECVLEGAVEKKERANRAQTANERGVSGGNGGGVGVFEGTRA